MAFKCETLMPPLCFSEPLDIYKSRASKSTEIHVNFDSSRDFTSQTLRKVETFRFSVLPSLLFII